MKQQNIHIFLWSLLTIILCESLSEMSLAQIDRQDLTLLPIDELMKIKVITVSRVPEQYAEAIAAIRVLPGETLKRAGTSCIPEALRLVQGVEVARFDANKWAISSRGFNHIFSNKQLVLMDGRSLYTPIWSGVFWDAQDTYLEDIDRIEVIRGSSGSMWGANAVNGIVNILTKDASETEGLVFNAGTGSELKLRIGFRYGDQITDNWYYRIYGKYQQWDNQVLSDGSNAHDTWGQGMGGIRLDGHPDPTTHISFQMLGYKSSGWHRMKIAFPNPPYIRTTDSNYKTSGLTVLGLLNKQTSDVSHYQLQIYYDYLTRRDPILIQGWYRAFDLDYQHQWGTCDWNELLWGMGYRYMSDHIVETFALAVIPERRVYPLYSAFIQDQMHLFSNRLRLIIGSKFEQNEFSGFEYQPNFRVMWDIKQHHHIWGAVARAVRTPSRADLDTRFPLEIVPGEEVTPAWTGKKIIVAATGSKKFKSEILHAYDLGYRYYSNENYFIDVAGFYYQYDQLRSYEFGAPRLETIMGQQYPMLPYMQYNDEYGTVYGIELGMDCELNDDWRFHGAYSQLKMDLKVHPPSTYPGSEGHEGETPERQYTFFTTWDISKRQDVSVIFRYVDAVPGLKIDSYFVTDLNYRVRINDHVELNLVAQNLGYPHHAEFREGPIPFISSEVKQSVFTNLIWRY
ncbi:TonB-dependent receptor [candidate division KSB1 bacterium]|nr:TonB-dependent receptor [candidate division KSB1 bacterium]